MVRSDYGNPGDSTGHIKLYLREVSSDKVDQNHVQMERDQW